MQFTSIHFLLFFIFILIINSFLRNRSDIKKKFLLIASYYFYCQWNWKYLFLLVLTTSIDYYLGKRIYTSKNGRFIFLVTSITYNLVILSIFKYSDFLIKIINDGSKVIGANLSVKPLNLMLPIGISFYTFQSLTYTIDIYRHQLKPRTTILDYALFISFFPQLASGPIVRAREFFPQLDLPKKTLPAQVQLATTLILFGFVKKLVFADNLVGITNKVFDNPASFSSGETLLAAYAYAFQIYFDFAGYTDIAIGVALLLGFNYPKNFNYPYLASSFKEFWRRWHMTLSRWIRDYLYFSLGGSRAGQIKTLSNLMTTMLLCGLWHGASWNFVLWGGLHGAGLAIERQIYRLIPWIETSRSKILLFVRWALTFQLICTCWIFFRSTTIHHAMTILRKISELNFTSISLPKNYMSWLMVLFFLGIHFLGGKFNIKHKISNMSVLPFSTVLAAGIIAILVFMPGQNTPFIYFQF